MPENNCLSFIPPAPAHELFPLPVRNKKHGRRERLRIKVPGEDLTQVRGGPQMKEETQEIRTSSQKTEDENQPGKRMRED